MVMNRRVAFRHTQIAVLLLARESQTQCRPSPMAVYHASASAAHHRLSRHCAALDDAVDVGSTQRTRS